MSTATSQQHQSKQQCKNGSEQATTVPRLNFLANLEGIQKFIKIGRANVQQTDRFSRSSLIVDKSWTIACNLLY